MSKAIYLTTMELKILLYKKKIDGIMVFEELTGKIKSDIEVKEALESLITNKYLVPFGDAFSFSQEIERIMGILKRAEYCFRVQSRGDKAPARCMYRAENESLLMQMDIRSKDLVRLETFEGDDALWLLADGDYMPSFTSLYDGMTKVEYVDLHEKFNDSGARLLIERYKRGTFSPDRTILVSEGDVKDELFLEKDGALYLLPYTAEAFRISITEDEE